MCLLAVIINILPEPQKVSQKLKTLEKFCKIQIASFFIHILLYSSE